MGALLYDSKRFEFDDRVLAHLQLVIVDKLRRREGFLLSWRDAPEAGSGRNAIWLDPSIPLYFKFDGSRPPSINREWLSRLAECAERSTGLIVVPEDGDRIRASGRTDTVPSPVQQAAGASRV